MHPTTFVQKGERSQRCKVVSALGLGLFLLFGQGLPVLGNPEGGNVVAGSASINGAGNTVTINQGSNAAVINWQGFSINAGEVTKFVVPNSAAATLNRVTGGNPSAIYGTLSSNGKVFLINPSGIIVGPSGRIDTHGFLGSTLDISNDEFMKGGDMHFLGTSDAKIDNQGTIHATGGDVYLIAKQVDNNGTISAPHGNVGIAAGLDVLFQQAGDQHLFVQATPSGAKRATGVTNAGTIRAASAELKAAGGNAYALAINNTGVIAATGYKKINGQVYLTSDGGNITNSGKIAAKTADGNGGKIVLNGHGNSSSGTVLNSGQLIASGNASGKTGGTVEVLGSRVGITDQGLVDVSGDAGGGTALIGGDRHGDNPAIVNADETYLGPDAQIIADALRTGNGGKVILWGNQTTQAYGTISAKGGELSGNGGFVETSAPTLYAHAKVNTLAPHGATGTWLLDPTDVDIDDNNTTSGNVTSPVGNVFTITGSSGNATINQADILTALLTSNVTIDASQGTGAANGGTISWNQSNHTAFDIASIGGNTLTLDSPVFIILNGISIVNSGTGSLNLVLNSSLTGAGAVEVLNSSIVTGGGNFTANGNGYTSFVSNSYDFNGVDINASTVNAQGGTINLKGTGGYGYSLSNTPPLQAGSGVSLYGGSVVETTGSGNIVINGTYSQTGNSFDFITGVSIDAFGGANTIMAGAGTITITGVVTGTYGNDTFSSSATGVEITDSNTIQTLSAGGAINISGDTSGSVVYDNGSGGNNSGGSSGVNIGDSNGGPIGISKVSVASGGSITITGIGGTVHTNSTVFVPYNSAGTTGTSLNDGSQVTASGNSSITIQGTGGTVVVDSGNIETNSFGVVLFNQGKRATSTTTVSSGSGLIQITGIGGSSPNLGIGVLIGGVAEPGAVGQGHTTIQSTSGNININGTGGAGNSGPGSFPGFWQPNSGIAVLNSATVSTSAVLTFFGTGTVTSGGTNGYGVAAVEVTDPNFDTSPMLPTLGAGSLVVSSGSGSGISLQANISSSNVVLNAPSGALGTNQITVSGPLTTSLLTIAAGADVTINGGVSYQSNNYFASNNHITALGPITSSGVVSIFTNSNLTVTGAVSGYGYVDLVASGNLTLGPNAQIIQLGNPAPDNNTPNIGSDLEAGQYFINNSNLGANVFQLSNGGYYFLFSHDPSSTVLGGLTPDFTQNGLTFSDVLNAAFPFPVGNGLFYALATSTLPPPAPPPNGSNIIAAVTPQNNQIAPQPPQNNFGGASLVPVSYTGNGMASQSGGTGGDLANSSGGGGSVGSGDAAQLSQGELNNVTNPAASNSLNEALSPLVFGTLTAALNTFGNDVSPATDSGPGDDQHNNHAENTDTQDLNSNDVVVIGGNGVQKIPLSQAPKQLQDALNNNTRSGLNQGAGH